MQGGVSPPLLDHWHWASELETEPFGAENDGDRRIPPEGHGIAKTNANPIQLPQLEALLEIHARPDEFLMIGKKCVATHPELREWFNLHSL